jgi:hypothetical protein
MKMDEDSLLTTSIAEMSKTDAGRLALHSKRILCFKVNKLTSHSSVRSIRPQFHSSKVSSATHFQVWRDFGQGGLTWCNIMLLHRHSRGSNNVNVDRAIHHR